MRSNRKKYSLSALFILFIIPTGYWHLETIRNTIHFSYLSLIKMPLLAGNTSGKPDFIKEYNSNLTTNKLAGFRVESGSWDIEEAVILDGPLSIAPGTTFNFAPDAYIIIKGALKAQGDNSAPIRFQGKDGRLWMGLYIYQAEEASRLENVIISNTNSLTDGLLELSGGVTFYKSDVVIKDTIFDSSQADDGLTIIKSTFDLMNVRFANMKSDGFDSEFSVGSFVDGTFIKIGGDAIDYEATEGTIENPQILNVRDKAISAGENSNIKIIGGFIKNVGVAVASKDGSVVEITKTKIEDVSLFSFMTFIKKPTYDAPILKARNVSLINKGTGDKEKTALRQSGTTLTIDGQDVLERSVDVKALYRSAVMSK